jgi:hypothetical protein
VPCPGQKIRVLGDLDALRLEMARVECELERRHRLQEPSKPSGVLGHGFEMCLDGVSEAAGACVVGPNGELVGCALERLRGCLAGPGDAGHLRDPGAPTASANSITERNRSRDSARRRSSWWFGANVSKSPSGPMKTSALGSRTRRSSGSNSATSSTGRAATSAARCLGLTPRTRSIASSPSKAISSTAFR